jgi:hypothetical protein
MDTLHAMVRGIVAAMFSVTAIRAERVDRPTRIWWAVPGAEIPFGLIDAIEKRGR